MWGNTVISESEMDSTKGLVSREHISLILVSSESHRRHGKLTQRTKRRKEDSVELARELLIAISHSVPDKVVLNSSNGWVYENGHCNGFVKRDSDELEDIRSELISISTGKSPEKIKLPAVGI